MEFGIGISISFFQHRKSTAKRKSSYVYYFIICVTKEFTDDENDVAGVL